MEWKGHRKYVSRWGVWGKGQRKNVMRWRGKRTMEAFRGWEQKGTAEGCKRMGTKRDSERM
jgi:hypothetical protein